MAKPQLVQAAGNMDSDTFLLHIGARHRGAMGLTRMPRKINIRVELSYRALHRKIHQNGSRLNHVHSREPMNRAVEDAIISLAENNARGWYEIAGIDGFVSCLADGSIHTRVGTRTKVHSDAESAALRLLEGMS
jgi:hypothetical protein